jgi:DNA polymerase III epsilon subunit-like protein
MEVKIVPLVGTPKQIVWAEKIRQELIEMYPDSVLPDNRYAEWWISNRSCNIKELFIASTKIQSPFTSQFPRFTRADVEPLLRTMGNFAVLDTETSGITKTSEVVELSIVRLSTGDVLLNTLLCPKDIDAYATSKARGMHSFSLEEVQNAPTLPSVWHEIKDLLTRFHPCAYNWEFDGKMLRRSAMRWGLDVPSLSGTCAMKVFQAFMGSDDYYKLSEACAVLNVDQASFGVAHGSLPDTLATCELLRRMRSSIEESK